MYALFDSTRLTAKKLATGKICLYITVLSTLFYHMTIREWLVAGF